MSKKEIIKKTADYVRKKLEGESSGHDWWHTYRVWKIAKRLAKEEKADIFIVELAALLHDIEDWKYHGGSEEKNIKAIKAWLRKQKIPTEMTFRICSAVEDAVFRGEKNKKKVRSKESAIISDADQLDAIGALGIARGFMFAGNFRLPMYDPKIMPLRNMTEKQYKNFRRSTYTQINHFYEKLLLQKDLINTKTAKKLAEERHKYMEEFLDRFYKEWEGKL